MGLLRLGLVSTSSRAERRDGVLHHEEAGWSAIAGVFALLLLVEGAVVHLWLAQTDHAAVMWIALALHTYGFVWIVGDAQALRVKRTRLLVGKDGDPVLDVQVGLRGRARFPTASSVELKRGTWDRPGPGERLLGVSRPACP